MVVVKLQKRPSGKYYSWVLTLPKGFEKELTDKLGNIPFAYDLEIDAKGRLKGEPKFLK